MSARIHTKCAMRKCVTDVNNYYRGWEGGCGDIYVNAKYDRVLYKEGGPMGEEGYAGVNQKQILCEEREREKGVGMSFGAISIK